MTSNLELNQEEWIYCNPLQTLISITCQLSGIKSPFNLSKTGERMGKRLGSQQWGISLLLFEFKIIPVAKSH